jgi:hypothetical protein
VPHRGLESENSLLEGSFRAILIKKKLFFCVNCPHSTTTTSMENLFLQLPVPIAVMPARHVLTQSPHYEIKLKYNYFVKHMAMTLEMTTVDSLFTKCFTILPMYQFSFTTKKSLVFQLLMLY